ncbi:efflux RND transporter periplasmic adaptor subunit [Helicobacter kayseriensis]|uniref:efflux RND transporter periplasmic adaptor subunit n=1 Tax=Helicobacter kayseriensis TaxID=2905877 RepID=UPI001E4B969B|nr:efflux RND transporter periplasmic adaptor subunit [Helicobacter kayseriensis]MCE3047748.1 efflux RND transporter periplasmic adaptor subunit [Helicobacter kayseriensis]MCE3049101.1 efflux RND transporter periplasmic adaptor subunit [Helicobacter kayseriensis]
MREEVLKIVRPKPKIKKYLFLIFLLGGVLGVIYYQIKKPKEKLVEYITTHPIQGDITNSISATGTLNPLNEVQIGSQVSGIIDKLYVDTNDLVKKGQVLAKIDDKKILQELERNQAQLKAAEAQLLSLQSSLKDKKWQFDRLKKLHKESKGKYPSFADVQNAQVAYEMIQAEILSKEANIQEIRANIKSTQIDYDNTIITSPIDGVVLVRSIDVGQTVAASFSAPELFKVARNLEEMKLVVKISESDIGKIKLGQKVSFSVDAYPNRVFGAYVDKINYGSSVTDNIVSYEVTILVQNQDLLLRPGMSATATIQVQEVKDALLIPVSALYYSPKVQEAVSKKQPTFFAPPRRKRQTHHLAENKSIWILNNQKPQKQDIEVGISDGKYVQVEGLSSSAQVILEEKIQ